MELLIHEITNTKSGVSKKTNKPWTKYTVVGTDENGASHNVDAFDKPWLDIYIRKGHRYNGTIDPPKYDNTLPTFNAEEEIIIHGESLTKTPTEHEIPEPNHEHKREPEPPSTPPTTPKETPDIVLPPRFGELNYVSPLDEQRRIIALQCATRDNQGLHNEKTADDTIEKAKAFEKYLKGD